MHFHFDFDKTLQAAGVLLDADDKRMEYMRLLKLLYVTDRESLAETGRTLTGDRAVAAAQEEAATREAMSHFKESSPNLLPGSFWMCSAAVRIII